MNVRLQLEASPIDIYCSGQWGGGGYAYFPMKAWTQHQAN